MLGDRVECRTASKASRCFSFPKSNSTPQRHYISPTIKHHPRLTVFGRGTINPNHLIYTAHFRIPVAVRLAPGAQTVKYLGHKAAILFVDQSENASNPDSGDEILCATYLTPKPETCTQDTPAEPHHAGVWWIDHISYRQQITKTKAKLPGKQLDVLKN